MCIQKITYQLLTQRCAFCRKHLAIPRDKAFWDHWLKTRRRTTGLMKTLRLVLTGGMWERSSEL